MKLLGKPIMLVSLSAWRATARLKLKYSKPSTTFAILTNFPLNPAALHILIKAALYLAILTMPSFDIVSEVNQVEVQNALEQANKEITNRFDFKGSDARIERSEKTLTLFADDDFKLGQVKEVLLGKLAKRNVDTRCLEEEKIEKVSGNKVKQAITVKEGVDSELAKKIVKLLKDSKLKVQASIQGEAVRVNGAKRDVLQEAIALVRKSITDFPLQYQNFRD